MSASVIMHCGAFVLLASDTRRYFPQPDGSKRWEDTAAKIVEADPAADRVLVLQGLHLPQGLVRSQLRGAYTPAEVTAALEFVEADTRAQMPPWTPEDVRTMNVVAAWSWRNPAGLLQASLGFFRQGFDFYGWLEPGEARALLTTDVPLSVRSKAEAYLNLNLRLAAATAWRSRSRSTATMANCRRYWLAHNTQIARDALTVAAGTCRTVSPEIDVAIHAVDGTIQTRHLKASICGAALEDVFDVQLQSFPIDR